MCIHWFKKDKQISAPSNLTTITAEVLVYGTRWCGDTRRCVNQIKVFGVPYKLIDIDHDPEGEALVLKVNNGNRSVPTIIFPDGSTVTEPSEKALIAQLKKMAVFER